MTDAENERSNHFNQRAKPSSPRLLRPDNSVVILYVLRQRLNRSLLLVEGGI